jgi:heme A synthase
MKVEAAVFAVIFLFFVIIAAVYGFWSKEPTGLMALIFAGGLALLVTFYLFLTSRRIDPRPEDNLYAEVSDGAGEVGFYSPYSWWPLPLALSAAVVALGVIFGWWLVMLGVLALAMSVIGFVFEYYRGEHA